MLDLVDNAFDAGFDESSGEETGGRIEIDFDAWSTPLSSSIEESGIFIRNSCTSRVAPIETILEVYKSEKVDKSER